MIQTLQTSAATPGPVAQLWREQRASVDKSVREIRRWIVSKSSETLPPTAELGTMIAEFASLLRSHFDCGCELYDSLRDQLWCVEVESAKRTAEADHGHLLASLVTLSAELGDSIPSNLAFENWVEKLEWFFDQLDQHEEREADSFEWLLQANCD